MSSKGNKSIDFDGAGATPAEEYESIARKFIPGYEALYSLAEVLLTEFMPAEAKILVVGAGGGRELVAFGKAFPAAALTGIDPSQKMLDEARKKVEKENLQSRITLCCETIFGIEERNFDAATALLVMHFLHDNGEKLEFLKAIRLRLSPGAIFIIADYCADKKSPAFDLDQAVYKNHARRQGASAEMIEAADTMIRENLNCVSEKRVLELLRKAGFGEIKRFYQGAGFHGWHAVRL